MIFDKHRQFKIWHGNRKVRARDTQVTAGPNENTEAKYIREQEKE